MSYDFKIEPQLNSHTTVSKPPFVWTYERLELLKSLWVTQTPTAEIGRKLGCTKNVVIGKAHRLDLPIKPCDRKLPTRPANADRIAAIAQSIETSLSVDQIRAKHACGDRLISSIRLARGLKISKPSVTLKSIRSVMPVTVLPPAPPRPFAVQGACQWPFGEPGTKAFRFCGDAAPRYGVPAPHSYCMHHRSLAYSARRTAWAEAHQ